MSSPFVAEIVIFACNFAPKGWAQCNGQLLPISQNTALFSLLGTYFGGDGRQTFNLPDLRGRVAVGQGQGPGLAHYDQGQAGGAETVVLNGGQAPTHTHTMMAAANVTAPNPGPGLALGTPATAVKMYGAASPTALAPASIGPFGSGGPHENRQPYLALNYIIALTGIFPYRN